MAVQKSGCTLCGKRVNARGLCDTHYKQHKRAGTLPDRTRTAHLEINDRIKHLSIVDNITGCHVWIGTVDSHGYGRISFKHKNWLVHRLSYILKYGEIPDGVKACHKCDNPLCINPDHLFLGTQAENMDDMFSKGRGAVGAAYKRSELTDELVLRIKIDKRTQLEIAKDYGVSRTNISAIKTGRAWSHVKVNEEKS
jgi:hypothetical protein